MFKRIAMILGLVVLLGTGCASETMVQAPTEELPSSDEVVNVTFWHYYSGNTKEQLESIIDEFNETVGVEQNIIVEAIANESVVQLEEDIMEAAQGVVYANAMPDLFLAYEDKALELDELGVLADLNTYFTEEEFGVVEPIFLKEGKINDKQGILPVVKSSELFLLNDTAWQEFAAVSGRTYEDLLTWEGISEVASEYYVYSDGKAFFGMDSVENYIVTASKSLGVEVFDGETAEAVFDDGVLEPIYDYYVHNHAMGYFANEARFRSDDVKTGNIIAYVGSSASATYFPSWVETPTGEQEITCKALPYPSFEGRTPYVLGQGAGIAMANNGTAQEKASAEFLKFFLEQDAAFALQTSYIPVVSAYYELGHEEQGALLEEYGNLSDSTKEIYQLLDAQIETEVLFQSDAFVGSYEVRKELGNNFVQSAKASAAFVEANRASGMTDEECIESLTAQGQYSPVIEAVKQSLTNKNIKYR